MAKHQSWAPKRVTFGRAVRCRAAGHRPSPSPRTCPDAGPSPRSVAPPGICRQTRRKSIPADGGKRTADVTASVPIWGFLGAFRHAVIVRDPSGLTATQR